MPRVKSSNAASTKSTPINPPQVRIDHENLKKIRGYLKENYPKVFLLNDLCNNAEAIRRFVVLYAELLDRYKDLETRLDRAKHEMRRAKNPRANRRASVILTTKQELQDQFDKVITTLLGQQSKTTNQRQGGDGQ